MGPLALKLYLIVIMGVVPLIFGLLPLKLLNWLIHRPGGGSLHARTLISVLTCFAAGIILGVSLIELFPEARTNIADWTAAEPHRTDYPFVELFVGVGFLLCYFVEEFMAMLFGHHHGHDHAHGGIKAAPPRRRRLSDEQRCRHNQHGIANDAMSADSGSEAGGAYTTEKQRPLSPRFDRTPGIDYASMAPCHDTAPLQVHVVGPIAVVGNVGNGVISLTAPVSPANSVGADEFGSATQIAALNDDVAAAEAKIADDASYADDGEVKDCHRKAAIGAVTLVAALLLHTSLEGFAFGIQKEVISVGSLFFGIIVHKVLVFFSVGMNMAQAMPNNPRLVVILIVLLAFFSPIGAIIGIVVEEMEIGGEVTGITSTIFICVSIGTFIYIALFEILAPERHKRVNRMLQWTGCAIGFVFMSSVLSLAGHGHVEGHSGGHGHLHDHEVKM